MHETISVENRKGALILSVLIRKKGILNGFSEPVTAAVITVTVFRVRPECQKIKIIWVHGDRLCEITLLGRKA